MIARAVAGQHRVVHRPIVRHDGLDRPAPEDHVRLVRHGEPDARVGKRRAWRRLVGR